MSREKFIQQVLIHLPPKHFKMISRFGFYACRKSDTLKIHMALLQRKKKKNPFSFYINSMLENFQINPFICPNCHIPMRKKNFTLLCAGMEERFISHIFLKPNSSLGFFRIQKNIFSLFRIFFLLQILNFFNILLLLSIYNFLKKKRAVNSALI
ncbi:hypothetical protein IX293_002264 [Fusobacterium necrophorum]|nr:hypothetical protein [Fusobacterium necrophorum]